MRAWSYLKDRPSAYCDGLGRQPRPHPAHRIPNKGASGTGQLGLQRAHLPQVLQADLDKQALPLRERCCASGRCGYCTGAVSRRCTCWARTSGSTSTGEQDHRVEPTPTPEVRLAGDLSPRRPETLLGLGDADSLAPARVALHPAPRNQRTSPRNLSAPNIVSAFPKS